MTRMRVLWAGLVVVTCGLVVSVDSVQGQCCGADKKAVAKEEAAECPYDADVKKATNTPGCCGTKAAAAATQTPEGAKHFGAAFTVADSVELAQVVAAADAHTGKTIRVSAVIDNVCQKSGCWFVLKGENGSETVRVKLRGFFLPKDSAGAKVVVEGLFTRIELSEAARKHLAEDAGKDSSKVSGTEAELTMVASAVDLLP